MDCNCRNCFSKHVPVCGLYVKLHDYPGSHGYIAGLCKKAPGHDGQCSPFVTERNARAGRDHG